jgi:hypothetical protein
MPGWTYIYVITCSDDRGHPFSKIGISGDPGGRLKHLQTSSPFALELLVGVQVPTRQIAKWVEGAVHAFMHLDCVRGEWFRCDPVKCGIAVCVAIEEAYRIAGFTEDRLYNFLEKSGVAPALEALMEFAP